MANAVLIGQKMILNQLMINWEDNFSFYYKQSLGTCLWILFFNNKHVISGSGPTIFSIWELSDSLTVEQI